MEICVPFQILVPLLLFSFLEMPFAGMVVHSNNPSIWVIEEAGVGVRWGVGVCVRSSRPDSDT